VGRVLLKCCHILIFQRKYRKTNDMQYKDIVVSLISVNSCAKLARPSRCRDAICRPVIFTRKVNKYHNGSNEKLLPPVYKHSTAMLVCLQFEDAASTQDNTAPTDAIPAPPLAEEPHHSLHIYWAEHK
jgi:hypothetical protein